MWEPVPADTQPLAQSSIVIREISGLTPFEINRLGLARSFQITNIFPDLSLFENIRCLRLTKSMHQRGCFRVPGY